MKLHTVLAMGVLATVVTSIPADVVDVQPADSYATVLGAAGWQPAQKVYTVINTCTDWVYWQTSTASQRVFCTPWGSWIGPGASLNVSITPVASMSIVSSGTYSEQIAFSFDPRVMGDINGDGNVNVGDLQLLIAAWGTGVVAGTSCPANDLNGDGVVNVGDLILLVQSWGRSYGTIST